MSKCPNCGNKLISEIKGSSLIIRCTKCYYSVATTHIDPIYEDDNEYEVFLEKGNEITKENYFLIQSLTNMSMLEIKHLFEATPYLLFKGLAPEVKELKEKLDKCGISYSIVPEFKY